MKKYIIIFACLMVAGCVTDNKPSSGEQTKGYLEIWMARWNQENGKDVKPDAMGMYLLDDVPGPANAKEWDENMSYTYASTTIRTLSGTITSTDDANLAKQLGTFAESYYYGPKVFATGENYSYAGLDHMLKGMRMGGTRTMVIPAWMLTVSRYSNLDGYLDACNSTTCYIYTVTLADQFDDVTAWEKERITDYVNANHPGATTTKFPELDEDDGTYWFITDVTGFSEDDIREETASNLKLYYTGKRLDGQVFDTNVEKTAVDYDIYNPSSSYTPATLEFSSTWSSISMNSSSSLIEGFKAGLSMMWWAGQKATVIFTSSHGYSATGQGNAIPGYCPLVFELELVGE